MGDLRFQRWQVGDARITRVIEMGDMAAPPDTLMEHVTPEIMLRHDWLRPDFADADGNMIFSVQCFVVEADGRTIVIDSCVGNDKIRTHAPMSGLSTAFLEDFRAAGFDPDTIDIVLCTHLHLDHVGWNTRLVDGRWVPTFPKARYLFSRIEWETITAPDYVDWGGDIYGDSLAPVMAAGLVDLVETDHIVGPSVRFLPTPGHSPGHVAVEVRSGGRTAVITGDMIHHPVQCAEPGYHTRFCGDPALSIATRGVFLASCCGSDTLVIGSHFPSWTGGHVVANGGAYRLERATEMELRAD